MRARGGALCRRESGIKAARRRPCPCQPGGAGRLPGQSRPFNPASRAQAALRRQSSMPIMLRPACRRAPRADWARRGGSTERPLPLPDAWRAGEPPRARLGACPPLLPGRNGPWPTQGGAALHGKCGAAAGRPWCRRAGRGWGRHAAGRHPRRRAGSGCPPSPHARPSRGAAQLATTHNRCRATGRRLGKIRLCSRLVPAAPGADLVPGRPRMAFHGQTRHVCQPRRVRP